MNAENQPAKSAGNSRSAIRALLFSLAGFGCITAAAWVVHLALGLLLAGFSLLILDWMIDRSGRVEEDQEELAPIHHLDDRIGRSFGRTRLRRRVGE